MMRIENGERRVIRTSDNVGKILGKAIVVHVVGCKDKSNRAFWFVHLRCSIHLSHGGASRA